jgi:hypothetical protein
MIDYDMLDEEYEGYAPRERVQRSMTPTGSLTDNLRLITPNRNGAHKRARSMKESSYYCP